MSLRDASSSLLLHGTAVVALAWRWNSPPPEFTLPAVYPVALVAPRVTARTPGPRETAKPSPPEQPTERNRTTAPTRRDRTAKPVPRKAPEATPTPPPKPPDPRPAPETPKPAANHRASVRGEDAAPQGGPLRIEGDAHITDAFRQHIVSRIGRHWSEPSNPSGKERRAVIFFRIARDGHLLETQLESPSGSAAFDRAALNAIRRSNPFWRLPPRVSGAHLGIHFEFIQEGTHR